MSSDKKKDSKKKTRIDDLEPHEDDEDAKGGATLSLASTDTNVTADRSSIAYKITPPDSSDLSYKITPETKPTKR